MERGVAMNRLSSPHGFSLMETMIAVSVLTVGVLGAAGILATGMQNLSSSPGDVVVTQKAAQAIEAVFSARDSHTLTWEQIRNVRDGGVFVDDPQPLREPGPDGLVNTTDDETTIETVQLPGRDGTLDTADDQTSTLSQYTRDIQIVDVPNENGALRSITVTITYRNGPTTRTYTLASFISSYS
jgi:prepilin-type N-terminal cleavage/methylation domain-containing protein